MTTTHTLPADIFERVIAGNLNVIDVPTALNLAQGDVLILETGSHRARVVIDADVGRFPWTVKEHTNVRVRRESEVSS